ncbi:hypothetical protein [Yinghuangia seranimata]|uniref:hypothetical protein n=1 Tax=Yinghuangia seranimata TaxID=408067 RepID=UPI00248C3660|nr:hypothetical protein [Yinghuangia seranimata]MDI2128929.1 hypothetical protein [Yinghuangia seranimata]
MLHLTDPQTGRPQPVAPPGVRRLRVAYCPASLRAAVTADLVRRAAERARLVTAVAAHTCPEAPVPDLMAFNVHPPNAEWDAASPPDVDVVPTGHPASPARARFTIAVGPDPESGAADADPLAVRLALLGRAPGDPAPGADEFAAAAVRLRELRADVARFAESPSAAPPADRIAAWHTAVDDGLDTPGALTLLNALAGDTALPEGARFEALVHLDRTLGLDLASDVGRVPLG